MSHMVNQDFQARLQRIDAANPKPQRRKKTKRESLSETGRNALYPLSFVGAFLLGIVAVFLVRFVRAQYMGEESGDDFFLVDAALSGFGSWGVGMMLKLRDPLLKSAQGFGVTATVMLMHNLAFWAPQTMAGLFSPSWVAMQESIATPNSINLMGNYVQLGAQDGARSAQSHALPKVTYMN